MIKCFDDHTEPLLYCDNCGDDISDRYYYVDDRYFCEHCRDAAGEALIELRLDEYLYYL